MEGISYLKKYTGLEEVFIDYIDDINDYSNLCQALNIKVMQRSFRRFDYFKIIDHTSFNDYIVDLIEIPDEDFKTVVDNIYFLPEYVIENFLILNPSIEKKKIMLASKKRHINYILFRKLSYYFNDISLFFIARHLGISVSIILRREFYMNPYNSKVFQILSKHIKTPMIQKYLIELLILHRYRFKNIYNGYFETNVETRQILDKSFYTEEYYNLSHEDEQSVIDFIISINITESSLCNNLLKIDKIEKEDVIFLLKNYKFSINFLFAIKIKFAEIFESIEVIKLLYMTQSITQDQRKYFFSYPDEYIDDYLEEYVYDDIDDNIYEYICPNIIYDTIDNISKTQILKIFYIGNFSVNFFEQCIKHISLNFQARQEFIHPITKRIFDFQKEIFIRIEHIPFRFLNPFYKELLWLLPIDYLFENIRIETDEDSQLFEDRIAKQLISNNSDPIDPKILSKIPLTLDFIKRYYKFLDPETLLEYQSCFTSSNISDLFDMKNNDIKYFRCLSKNKNLDVSIIKSFKDRLNMKEVLRNNKISEQLYNFILYSYLKRKRSSLNSKRSLKWLNTICRNNMLDFILPAILNNVESLNSAKAETLIKSFHLRNGHFQLISRKTNLTISLIEKNLSKIDFREFTPNISNYIHFCVFYKYLFYNEFKTVEEILNKIPNKLRKQFYSEFYFTLLFTFNEIHIEID